MTTLKSSRTILTDLQGIFGNRYSDEVEVRKRFSQDFSWLSPILSSQLSDRVADAVVWPINASELASLIDVAREARVPLTPRGGGTGNYGQAVPLDGGVVVDTTKMNQVIAVNDEELYAELEPGVNMAAFMELLDKKGLALRIFPSTYASSTMAGFFCGGSRGIGSTEYGTVWDGNLLAAKVMDTDGGVHTCEDAELNGVIHAQGTTGLVTELRVAIARKTEDKGLILSLASLTEAVDLCKRLIFGKFHKKLVSLLEPAIVKHYNRLLHEDIFDPEAYNVVLLYQSSEASVVDELLSRYRLKRLDSSADKLKHHIVEYSFNHVALWGKKADRRLTNFYMHFYDLEGLDSKIAQIKKRFGDDVLIHTEFTRQAGNVIVTSLSLMNFKSQEFYEDVIAFVRNLGANVINIHSYRLNDRAEPSKLAIMQEMKRRNDPYNIFNPGKLIW